MAGGADLDEPSKRPDSTNDQKRHAAPAAQPGSTDTARDRVGNKTYDVSKLEPSRKRPRSKSPSGDAAAPRKLKRPGARAAISEADRKAARERALERERLAREAAVADEERQQIDDVVKAHYNAVPERGRDWRKTDSRIKGLRSFNNWIKSCIIQKFSPDEDHQPGRGGGPSILVLDLGCGKGGDLGKWQQAPQHVELYVGMDPADVSIEQAKDRYRSMSSRGGRGGRGGRVGGRGSARLFEARFHVKDCFGEPINDIDIIRQVGFESGPHGGGRGFDVVSMMFCMHYAFETEQKARQMLKNVAGALRKGGRLIGAIPNSDVISNKVREHNARMAELKKKQAELGDDSKKDNSGEAEEGELDEPEVEKAAEWGNDIYRVRFPGETPEDGIFRPPFGWKYSFFLHEAVEEVPEYVVPWEAFRALAEDYNLELQWHRSFKEIWDQEKDDRTLGSLSERMNVRNRHTGELQVSHEELEAANFYVGFCFYKV